MADYVPQIGLGGYIKQRNAYINQRLGGDPYQLSGRNQLENPFEADDPIHEQHRLWQSDWDRLTKEYEATLDPRELQAIREEMVTSDAKNDKRFQRGAMLTKGMIGLMAGGAGLAAMGGAGAAAGGASMGGSGAFGALEGLGTLGAAEGAAAAGAGGVAAAGGSGGGMFGALEGLGTLGGAQGSAAAAGLAPAAGLGGGGGAAPAGAPWSSLLKDFSLKDAAGLASIGTGLYGATKAVSATGQQSAAPDPQLLQAQLNAMGIQGQAAQSILTMAANQAKYNAEMMPLQKEATQFALDTGRTAYDQSQQDRQWLLGRRGALTGLQDSMTKEAAEYDAASMGNTRANAAAVDVNKAYTDMQAAEDRNLASMGVTPGSGRYMAMRAARAPDLARTTVGAQNEARLGARQEGRMLTDRAAGALAGYPAQAMNATNAGANYGAGGVQAANQGAAGINSGYGAMTGAQQAAAGVAANQAAGATNMYGIQSGAFQNGQNSNNELYGSLLGLGSTLGAAYLGGYKPKP